MKKKTGILYTLLPLLLCAALFASMAAPAYAEEPTAAEDSGIIDGEALTAMVEDFIREHGLNAEKFSIGYCYTATGDEWYYNGDKWYYPASMYKVPLMMQLAEKVKSGELTQESMIAGRSVSEMEELILTYSNNDFAHTIRTELGGDEVWREAAKAYTSLPDDYYSPDYMDYCYFTPRFITQVMETLYFQPDRFPNVIDCLLKAQPTHYYRLSDRLNGVYDIAQKYGSFCDNFGSNFNHNTGIIYTPTPCIVTVMTLDAPSYEKVISDAAIMLTEYTLTLDEKLDPYREEQEAKAEAEAKAADEAEKAEAERAEAERAEAERAAAEQAAAVERQAILDKHARMRKCIVIAGAALAVLAVILTVADITSNAKRKKELHTREQHRASADRSRRSRR